MEDFSDLNGTEVDPDEGIIRVRNSSSLASTHDVLKKAGFKVVKTETDTNGTKRAIPAGSVPYQLHESVVTDRIVYTPNNSVPLEKFSDLNGAEVDPDKREISVMNRSDLAKTHEALKKAGFTVARIEKDSHSSRHAIPSGSTPYQK